MNKLVTIIILLIAGAFTIFYVNYSLVENARETWRRQREIVHNQATSTFETQVERYASIVSGLRSYMINRETFPNAIEMQDFLKEHIADLNFEDSVIISYLDVNHNFIYSISNENIDPSALVGINVGDYLSAPALRDLEKVFEDERLHLYKPVNLIEGLVGISFNFSIREQGDVVGYVTAIVNFRGIIQELYAPHLIEDFCYHFTTSEGKDFDRERVHDTRVFSDKQDPEYYRNFNLPESGFLYSNIELFDQKFRIGTSYKKPFSADLMIPITSGIWYIVFVIMVIYVVHQSRTMDTLNHELILKNEEVKEQSGRIEAKNALLEDANASKDRFFSIIGHDLKSPLQSIQSLISMRRDKMITAKETDKFLGILDQVNRKTVDLLDNLLEWATISIGNAGVNFDEISLNKIASETVQLLQAVSDLKSIQIIEKFDDNLKMNGDANMISVILRNILSNAIKFTHENGAIKFQGRDSGDVIEIIISDNGVGMPKDTLKNVFKVDKKTSSKGTDGEIGTGLGLPISKEYTDLHNGKIRVESEESKGTIFYITLPKNQPS